MAIIYAHNGIVKVHSPSSELVKDVEQLRNFTMMINTELEQRMFSNIKRLQDKLIHPLFEIERRSDDCITF